MMSEAVHVRVKPINIVPKEEGGRKEGREKTICDCGQDNVDRRDGGGYGGQVSGERRTPPIRLTPRTDPQ